MEANENDLIWVGSLEDCDLCHDILPMSWIVFTGSQFLCYSCAYDGLAIDDRAGKDRMGSQSSEEKSTNQEIQTPSQAETIAPKTNRGGEAAISGETPDLFEGESDMPGLLEIFFHSRPPQKR